MQRPLNRKTGPGASDVQNASSAAVPHNTYGFSTAISVTLERRSSGVRESSMSLMARKGSSRISRKPVAITRVTAGSGGVCQRWGHRHPGRLGELRQALGGTRLA